MNWVDDLSKSVAFAILLVLVLGAGTLVWMASTVVYMIIHYHGG